MVLIKQNLCGSRPKDRISELLEHLIHLILSFLPTQCVGCMSVLSKRWRYVWTSVPVIDLRELKFPKIAGLEGTNEEAKLQDQRFMNFVDKKLSLHHETGDIKTFYFDSNDFDNKLRLEVWLSALFTRHNLEEFVLYAESSPDEGFFPSCWKYASLVILELDTWNDVYLPDAINFPNLKICRLTHAYLRTSPALKYLPIIGPSQCTDFEGDFPIYGFTINIYAPNLQFLRYIDFDRCDTDMPMPQKYVPITTKVLKELCNVKCLKISGETFEELIFPDGPFTNWPTFHNLVRLELTSGISFSKDKTLLNFLRISPNLRTIVFARGFFGNQSSTRSGWKAGMVPQCVLLHLKSLNAVKTFLKNAKVLRRLIIKFSYLLKAEQNKGVTKKLLKFPRGSPSCEIQVL
ncbi:hypothetical protein MKX03_022226 [Papaver bracteatum]|nr:hypothetical protein MKX03_022226 [Papaver bracteatum]